VTTLVATDLDEVKRLHEEFIVANRTGDTAWCRAHMAPGDEAIILFNTNGSAYHGVEHWCSLWDYYRDHIKGDRRTGGKPPLFESVEPHYTVVGDAAWVVYRLRMVAKLDDVPVPEQARGTEIYQRLNGVWTMVHAHFSIGESGGPMGGR
jgi:ketosteroid isomerase-like protein